MALVNTFPGIAGLQAMEQVGLANRLAEGLTSGTCSIDSGDHFSGGSSTVVADPASVVPNPLFAVPSAEPQVTSGGTVLSIPLPTLPPALQALGQDWSVKPEFHLTLLGFARSAEIQKQLKAAGLSNSRAREALKEATEQALQGLTFHVSLRDEFRAAEHNGNRSVIVMASCPEMETFYQRLAGLLRARHGIEIDARPPPAHVTLYTGENGQAIGIASDEDLAVRTRPLSGAEVVGLAPVRQLLWPAPETAAPAVAIERIREHIRAYATRYEVRGLEGRLRRGLDPAGMLAVPETRRKLELIAGSLGVTNIEDLVAFTNGFHRGKFWENVEALRSGDHPVALTWMIAAYVTGLDKGAESELTDEAFLSDYQRINRLLDRAVQDPTPWAATARADVVDRAGHKFTMDGDVPYSEEDAHIEMAIAGRSFGVTRDRNGLLFVGARRLDYGVLEELGLRSVRRYDDYRKDDVTFYVNDQGQDVVKVLGPGFAIVFGGDRETARRLARTGA